MWITFIIYLLSISCFYVIFLSTFNKRWALISIKNKLLTLTNTFFLFVDLINQLLFYARTHALDCAHARILVTKIRHKSTRNWAICITMNTNLQIKIRIVNSLRHKRILPMERVTVWRDIQRILAVIVGSHITTN